MICKYIITVNTYNHQSTPCTSYGIKATDGIHTIEEIPNISTDREKVERLVETCNNLRLSSIHLQEVVEDMI